MQGLGEKKGKGQSLFGRRNWKQRYFSIDDQYFTYWTKRGGKRKGFCQSSKLERAQLRDIETSSYFYLSFLMEKREIFLRFSDKDERDKWYEAVYLISQGKSIAECSFIAENIIADPLEIFNKRESSIMRRLSKMKISQR